MDQDAGSEQAGRTSQERSLRRPLLIGGAVVAATIALAAVAVVGVIALAIMRIDSNGDDPAAVLDRSTTTATVSPGDRLEIHLAENPSIGDDWQPEEITGLTLTGRVLEMSGQERNVGAGGTRILTYEAVETGTHQLELTNCYRGDCTAPEAEQITFVVTVR